MHVDLQRISNDLQTHVPVITENRRVEWHQKSQRSMPYGQLLENLHWILREIPQSISRWPYQNRVNYIASARSLRDIILFLKGDAVLTDAQSIIRTSLIRMLSINRWVRELFFWLSTHKRQPLVKHTLQSLIPQIKVYGLGNDAFPVDHFLGTGNLTYLKYCLQAGVTFVSEEGPCDRLAKAAEDATSHHSENLRSVVILTQQLCQKFYSRGSYYFKFSDVSVSSLMLLAIDIVLQRSHLQSGSIRVSKKKDSLPFSYALPGVVDKAWVLFKKKPENSTGNGIKKGCVGCLEIDMVGKTIHDAAELYSLRLPRLRTHEIVSAIQFKGRGFISDTRVLEYTSMKKKAAVRRTLIQPMCIPLDKAPKLSLKESIAILADLASALETLHAEKKIHNDIKPENVLISPDRNKGFLIDFHLTEEYGRSLPSPQLEFLHGTGRNTCPYHHRVMRLKKGAGLPGDIYDFGALMYIVLTGKRPPWDLPFLKYWNEFKNFFHSYIYNKISADELIGQIEPSQKRIALYEMQEAFYHDNLKTPCISIGERVWHLMLKAFNPDPTQRITACDLRIQLDELLFELTPTTSTQNA